MLHECIGLYCGDIVHKQTLADTGYNIDWLKNRHYVVDAGGPGYPMYFGWHYANKPEKKEDANVLIDKDMRIFPLRDVKKGEEALFWYGTRHDNINNAYTWEKAGYGLFKKKTYKAPTK